MTDLNTMKREAKQAGIDETLTRLMGHAHAGLIQQAAVDVGLLWECPRCDLYNGEDDTNCDECETPKPKAG